MRFVRCASRGREAVFSILESPLILKAASNSTAKETTITLRKSAILPRQLTELVNGCPNAGSVLESTTIPHNCFFRTREDYAASFYCLSCDCVPEELIPLDCGWYLHPYIPKNDFMDIVAALRKAGLSTKGTGKGRQAR